MTVATLATLTPGRWLCHPDTLLEAQHVAGVDLVASYAVPVGQFWALK